VKTVFAIEQGCYSDYRVVGVYSSREAAERVCEVVNAATSYEKATVEEWPLNPGFDGINAGHKQFRVFMHRDGSVESAELYELIGHQLEDYTTILRRSQHPSTHGRNAKDVLLAIVWAKDAHHAIKIVNERRGQMIAMGEWEDAA
jgi:hypothetical protein